MVIWLVYLCATLVRGPNKSLLQKKEILFYTTKPQSQF
jgi:hypothetical protein